MDFKEIELKKIKELMNAMARSGTSHFRFKNDRFELELKKPEHFVYPSSAQEHHDALFKHETSQLKPAKPLPKTDQSSPQFKTPEIKEDPQSFIKSPMVGTFYATPNPGEPPFVKVGDKIEAGQVVCIIEAMKVMNEIKSEIGGVIAEVLIETGHPVEFGSKLFRLS